MGAKKRGARETPEESGGFKKRCNELRNVKGETPPLNYWPACAFQDASSPASNPTPCPLCAGASQGRSPLSCAWAVYLGDTSEVRLMPRLPGLRRERLRTRRKVGKGVFKHSGYPWAGPAHGVGKTGGLQAGPVLNAGRLFGDGRGLTGRKLLDTTPRSGLGFANILSRRSSPACRPQGTGDAQRTSRPPCPRSTASPACPGV